MPDIASLTARTRPDVRASVTLTPVGGALARSARLAEQVVTDMAAKNTYLRSLGIIDSPFQAREALTDYSVGKDFARLSGRAGDFIRSRDFGAAAKALAPGIVPLGEGSNLAGGGLAASLVDAVNASSKIAAQFDTGAMIRDMAEAASMRSTWADLSSLAPLGNLPARGDAALAVANVHAEAFASLESLTRPRYALPFIRTPWREPPPPPPLPLDEFEEERTEAGLTVVRRSRGRPLGKTDVSKAQFLCAAERYLATYRTVPSQSQMRDAIYQFVSITVSVDSVRRYAVSIFGSWQNFREHYGQRLAGEAMTGQFKASGTGALPMSSGTNSNARFLLNTPGVAAVIHLHRRRAWRGSPRPRRPSQ